MPKWAGAAHQENAWLAVVKERRANNVPGTRTVPTPSVCEHPKKVTFAIERRERVAALAHRHVEKAELLATRGNHEPLRRTITRGGNSDVSDSI
jgi:hypothetical protein